MRKSSPSTRDTSSRSNFRRNDGDRSHRREHYDPYYPRGSREGTRRNNQYRHRSPPAKLSRHWINWGIGSNGRKNEIGSKQRNLEHFCEFDKGHGHKTEDYHALQLAVADLLEQGHLTEFLSEKAKQAYYRNREQGAPSPLPEPKRLVILFTGGANINITGGMGVNKITYTLGVKFKRITTRSEKRDRLALIEDCITFDEVDADNMQFPNNDGLVVALRILDTDIKHVFVDQESAANIINIRVIEEIKLMSKITHKSVMLNGFNNSTERTLGEIILQVVAGGVELQTNFSIMSSAMAYNMIVGRP
ncbi:uncharacterized protein LOC132644314 [Lycium barbarum]|uniref:uncharacterized protein LOC132644314 n=1 Tax=Lycium barbarum TaxID=112863 RepID=UPI00293E5FD1|nr:uncharacterized protein LOC132644314 [Lycium barbarum]